jgi:hypothetical protein
MTADSKIRSEVKSTLEQSSRFYSIANVDKMTDVLAEIVDAITEDPPASWPSDVRSETRNYGDLTPFQYEIIKLTPVALAQVARHARIHKLTTFDLLHNMTYFIDMICPLEKEGR